MVEEKEEHKNEHENEYKNEKSRHSPEHSTKLRGACFRVKAEAPDSPCVTKRLCFQWDCRQVEGSQGSSGLLAD